jgi:hypothetical protein
MALVGRVGHACALQLEQLPLAPARPLRRLARRDASALQVGGPSEPRHQSSPSRRTHRQTDTCTPDVPAHARARSRTQVGARYASMTERDLKLGQFVRRLLIRLHNERPGRGKRAAGRRHRYGATQQEAAHALMPDCAACTHSPLSCVVRSFTRRNVWRAAVRVNGTIIEGASENNVE